MAIELTSGYVIILLHLADSRPITGGSVQIRNSNSDAARECSALLAPEGERKHDIILRIKRSSGVRLGIRVSRAAEPAGGLIALITAFAMATCQDNQSNPTCALHHLHQNKTTGHTQQK
ncbi:hypothetical protein EYF80_045211 [Liparis tanakae]|uniref:Uncharacterized protein n=1 Tax=Liparis tanakae TaxID=230148 RepID=A0A4Z2FTY2_9TELE|nr:hypothetical protein EYF80_045211 [Liparis tanakae]